MSSQIDMSAPVAAKPSDADIQAMLANAVRLYAEHVENNGPMPAFADNGPELGQPSPANPAPSAERTEPIPVEPVGYEGMPMPISNISPCPARHRGPWPHDEYLEDGGAATYVNLARQPGAGPGNGGHGRDLRHRGRPDDDRAEQSCLPVCAALCRGPPRDQRRRKPAK
jgi:hypothetical protein